MAETNSSDERRSRKGFWGYLLAGVGLVTLGLLVGLVALLAAIFLRPVKRLGGVRAYRVTGPTAAFPPQGVSGVNRAPTPWVDQYLRIGDGVVEWRWSSQRVSDPR